MARGTKSNTAAKNSRASKSVKAKATKEPSSLDSKDQAQNSSVSLELQQKCLGIFQHTLKPGIDDTTTLQEVKGHLYTRDFAAAFGKEEYLRVYASRWSPSRALGYLQVFEDIQDSLLEGVFTDDLQDSTPYKVVCLGGGAGAEIVALGSWITLQNQSLEASQQVSLEAQMIDIAAWDHVVDDLQRALTTPPELSKYASAAAREANVAMVPAESYQARFHQLNVLALESSQWKGLLQDHQLITLMFTLNELYSTSIAKTQQMLIHITENMATGALLLVVDSPGSYSTVSVNGAEKKYPMQWLLDYTLVGSQQKRVHKSPKWDRLVTDDSKWFRLPQGLRYPIELENMRYQIHLYRRLPD